MLDGIGVGFLGLDWFDIGFGVGWLAFLEGTIHPPFSSPPPQQKSNHSLLIPSRRLVPCWLAGWLGLAGWRAGWLAVFAAGWLVPSDFLGI